MKRKAFHTELAKQILDTLEKKQKPEDLTINQETDSIPFRGDHGLPDVKTENTVKSADNSVPLLHFRGVFGGAFQPLNLDLNFWPVIFSFLNPQELVFLNLTSHFWAYTLRKWDRTHGLKLAKLMTTDLSMDLIVKTPLPELTQIVHWLKCRLHLLTEHSYFYLEKYAFYLWEYAHAWNHLPEDKIIFPSYWQDLTEYPQRQQIGAQLLKLFFLKKTPLYPYARIHALVGRCRELFHQGDNWKLRAMEMLTMSSEFKLNELDKINTPQHSIYAIFKSSSIWYALTEVSCVINIFPFFYNQNDLEPLISFLKVGLIKMSHSQKKTRQEWQKIGFYILKILSNPNLTLPKLNHFSTIEKMADILIKNSIEGATTADMKDVLYRCLNKGMMVMPPTTEIKKIILPRQLTKRTTTAILGSQAAPLMSKEVTEFYRLLFEFFIATDICKLAGIAKFTQAQIDLWDKQNSRYLNFVIQPTNFFSEIVKIKVSLLNNVIHWAKRRLRVLTPVQTMKLQGLGLFLLENAEIWNLLPENININNLLWKDLDRPEYRLRQQICLQLVQTACLDYRPAYPNFLTKNIIDICLKYSDLSIQNDIKFSAMRMVSRQLKFGNREEIDKVAHPYLLTLKNYDTFLGSHTLKTLGLFQFFPQLFNKKLTEWLITLLANFDNCNCYATMPLAITRLKFWYLILFLLKTITGLESPSPNFVQIYLATVNKFIVLSYQAPSYSEAMIKERDTFLAKNIFLLLPSPPEGEGKGPLTLTLSPNTGKRG